MKRKVCFVLALFLCLTGLSPAQPGGPQETTRSVYDWYLENPMTSRERLSDLQPYLDPVLYQLLADAFVRTPEDGFFVDFDPFVNAQVPAGRFQYGEPYLTGDSAFVRVTPYLNMGEGGSTVPMPDIKVYLKKLDGQWRLANLIYTGENAFELRDYLQKGLGGAAQPGAPRQSASDVLGPEDLHGTWVHKSTSSTVDGIPRPLTMAEIKWTFRPDGSGTFYQKVGGRPMVGDMNWTLEGSTISLGGRTQYTVMKRLGPDKMIWKNHRLGDFYHVVKE